MMTEQTQLSRADNEPATSGTSVPTSASRKPSSAHSAAGANAVERPIERAVEPAVEIFEDAGGITVLADMPGVPREGLNVQLDGDTLVIEGEAAVLAPEGMRGLWAEINVPRYRRAFTLGRELDVARIEAGVKDGVLTLRIPKQAHAQPRRIAVSTT
ncbi:Hsp20/alpha crystallin family protein [Mitsuaria sp. CC2]|jgi:HSP20 family protein